VQKGVEEVVEHEYFINVASWPPPGPGPDDRHEEELERNLIKVTTIV
jgi:hypothetical protein